MPHHSGSRTHSAPLSNHKRAYQSTRKLRIISGQWRNRKLPVAHVTGLRPTPDRIRETLFNWLGTSTEGATVLDVFSGTGALSLEALSRGAKSAIMLEKSSTAVTILRNNLTLLKALQATVIETDSTTWLKKQAQHRFDLVFLDPPFFMNLIAPTCHLLEQNGYVTTTSRIYIETEKELQPTPVPKTWQIEKSKNAGRINYSLWSISTKQL